MINEHEFSKLRQLVYRLKDSILSKISHDTTLTGDGTISSPLKVKSGSGGTGAAEKNKVILNADLPEVPGIQYQSYADAIAYILTQTHDATHLWVIQFTDFIIEDITVYEYIEVAGSGTRSSWIDGDVDCVSAGGIPGCIISNCVIGNINITSVGSELVNFKNCVILDSTTSVGTHSVKFDECMIVKGDYTMYSDIYVTKSNFISYYGDIVFDEITLVDSDIDTYMGNTITFKIVHFIKCLLSLCDVIITETGNFQMCMFKENFTIPLGVNINVYQSRYENTFTVNGELNTKMCSFVNLPIIGTGTWDNDGEVYDNRTSGLTALNMQEAVDELANIKADKAVGVNGSFVVGAQTFTITDGIITSIV
jgi:hypothetical protein